MPSPNFSSGTNQALILLLILCGLAGLPQSQVLAQQKTLPEDIADATGKPTLTTPEEIEILIAKRGDESALPHMSKNRAERSRSIISFMRNTKNRNMAEGSLREGECITAAGIYHKPQFILHGDEERISLSQLIDRAEIAIVAEVVSAQSGLVGDMPGTLVHLRILQNLNESTVPIERELYYGSLDYHFEINGELFCRQRTGFYQEKTGDIVLIAARPTRFPQLILPYGVFAIKNGIVQPQPYEFLLPTEPTAISGI